MSDLMELDDQDYGVEDRTSQGEPESTATPQSRQPKVNLDEIEEFRSWKSATDKRDANYQRTIQQLQQQTNEYNARLRRIEMEGLDDTGKLAYENRELRALLQQNEEEKNRLYAQARWDSLVDEVVKETGVSRKKLEEAEDSNDLWRIGLKHQGKGAKARDDDDDDVVRPDRVSLGGGNGSSVESRLRSEYRKAKDDNDWSAMNAVKEKAFKAGIDPDSLRR